MLINLSQGKCWSSPHSHEHSPSPIRDGCSRLRRSDLNRLIGYHPGDAGNGRTLDGFKYPTLFINPALIITGISFGLSKALLACPSIDLVRTVFSNQVNSIAFCWLSVEMQLRKVIKPWLQVWTIGQARVVFSSVNTLPRILKSSDFDRRKASMNRPW